MQKIFKSRIWLVVLGVGLGLLARATLDGPDNSEVLPRIYSGELGPAPEEDPLPDLELKAKGSEQGLVPPIRVPAIEAASGVLDKTPNFVSVANVFDTFAHDEGAVFHAHGEEVCASGCAASRHPTEELNEEHFNELMVEFSSQPLTEDSPALEQLLYFGPQARKLIEKNGFGPLDSERATFLWEELETARAKISIRVIDETGTIRVWLDPTMVPFDRRHVFKMETENLQPLVTSGTVKRVGLNHIWVRL